MLHLFRRTLHSLGRWLAGAILLPVGVLFAAPPEEMPLWFWTPPHTGNVRSAVGYAGAYYTPASSYEEAFQDAAQRLWTDRRCRIVVKTGSSTIAERTLSIGNVFRIEADTTGYAAFRQSLVRLDSCWTDSLVVMLAGTSALDITPWSHPAPAPELEMDRNAGFVQGTGFAPLYYHTASSWREAENAARRDLALAAEATVQSLTETRNDQLARTLVLESDVTVAGIHVLGRYREPVSGVFVVVVTAPAERVHGN